MSKLETAISELEKGTTKSLELLLKELGVEGSVLSKDKTESILDKNIVQNLSTKTVYSGSWGVPNPTYTTNLLFPDEGISDEEMLIWIKNKKLTEKEYQKNNKPNRESYNSTYSQSYKVTTLRRFLKKWDKRNLSSRGSMSSIYYDYMIGKM